MSKYNIRQLISKHSLLYIISLSAIAFGLTEKLGAFIHEFGHYIFGYISGGRSCQINIGFMSSSSAGCVGADINLQLLGGPLLVLLFGLLCLTLLQFIKKRKRTHVFIDLVLLFGFLEGAIPSSSLYLFYSVLIKWGDGFSIVERLDVNPILFVVILACIAAYFLKLFNSGLRDAFKKLNLKYDVRTLFIFWAVWLCFVVGPKIIFKPENLFRYTWEQSLITVALGTILFTAMSGKLSQQKLNS